MEIHAKTALVGSDWLADIRVELDNGHIHRVTPGVPARATDTRVDVLLPGVSNLHSHAFQRAMAGMTEVRTEGRESFWSWRTLMYQFLDRLTPDQIQAIAALVFMEMQEAGYSAVGEFHYVHHQPGGDAYAQLSETSQRVFEAAHLTGMGLTHLPVLYTYGGVGRTPLAGGQLRFGNTVDRFLKLVQECQAALPHADSALGVAPHSLRATSPADLASVLEAVPHGPVHIHIAEQLQEVADVETALGQRPVAWLLDNAEVTPRWCLVHATHMTADETTGVARSGAVAGLCPITEANLGDGIFDGAAFVEQGGQFGVGSDSNIRISLGGELCLLEYSQRLRDKSRAVLVTGAGSVGQALYTGAAQGGAQALGRNAGEIAAGKLADLVAIDRTHPTLCALRDDQLLDGLCFAAPDGMVTDLWSAGRHMVRGGRHIARDAIVAEYRTAMTRLLQGT